MCGLVLEGKMRVVDLEGERGTYPKPRRPPVTVPRILSAPVAAALPMTGAETTMQVIADHFRPLENSFLCEICIPAVT